MAPPKKQDSNGEEFRLEPQLPENAYPFSQRFSANLQKDSTSDENMSSAASAATAMENEGISAPSPSEQALAESGTASPSPAGTIEHSAPEASSIPKTSPDVEIPPAPETSSVQPDTPHSDGSTGSLATTGPTGPLPSTGMSTLPPIPPHAEGFADSRKEELPETPVDNNIPSLPASAFSRDDYLTTDEARAYIHGDSFTATSVENNENEPRQGTAPDTPGETAIPKLPFPPQQNAFPGNADEKGIREADKTPEKQMTKLAEKATSKEAGEETGKKQAAKPLKKSLFSRKKAKTPEHTLDQTPGETPGKKSDKAAEPSPTASTAQPFFSSHPILKTPPSIPGGLSNALFNSCSFAPWLILTLLFVAQTLFTLDVRALWYSDEVRHAAVFTSMLNEGNIFKLELNGQLYPDKPSLYFWFLRGLYEIFQEEGPRLYFGAAAISGLLYLWATLLLGRLVGRFDGRSLLAGGILLISGCYFMGVTHYARMDLLFSTFILGSYIAFFMAFAKQKAPLFMALAFILGALACLTKGPLGLLLPLSALFLFTLWTGKIRRFISMDFLMGLVIATLIIGGWLVGLYTETSLEYIQDQIVGKQVLERAVDAFHHKAKWSYYLERLPILLLPWVTIVLCLPFHKLLSKNALSVLVASRKPEREGQAFLWCIILSALILLSAVSTKIIIYMLPVLPAMCLLSGRAVLQLSGKRAVLFKLLLGLTLLVAGFVLFIATLKVFGSFPLPEFIDKHIPAWQIPPSAGFFIATGILCAAALFLVFGIPSSRPEAVLLTLALMATGLAYPLFGMAAPSLDTILSPKAQGEIIKEHMAEGYYPLTYDMYDGVYTYYAGAAIEEIYSVEEITAKLKEHPHIILAIQQRALNKITDMPECFEPVHKQLIEQHEYVLLACPPLPTTPAAGQESSPDDTVQGELPEETSAPETVTGITEIEDAGAKDATTSDTETSGTRTPNGLIPDGETPGAQANDADTPATERPETKTPDKADSAPETVPVTTSVQGDALSNQETNETMAQDPLKALPSAAQDATPNAVLNTTQDSLRDNVTGGKEGIVPGQAMPPTEAKPANKESQPEPEHSADQENAVKQEKAPEQPSGLNPKSRP